MTCDIMKHVETGRNTYISCNTRVTQLCRTLGNCVYGSMHTIYSLVMRK